MEVLQRHRLWPVPVRSACHRAPKIYNALVTAAGNPYAASVAPGGQALLSEEGIRRAANRSAVFAALAVFVVSLAAPVAVLHGHRALSAMKRSGLGQQHRGAALVGVVLGWVWMPFFVLQLVTLAGDLRDVLVRMF
jgi:hypothetical protein